MKLSITNYIKKLEKKQSQIEKYKKVLALELKGHLQRNISQDKVTPKAIKEKGKTLYDKGSGLKNIAFQILPKVIKFGNYLEYMGWQNNGTKRLPERKWLFWTDEAKKAIRSWASELWK